MTPYRKVGCLCYFFAAEHVFWLVWGFVFVLVRPTYHFSPFILGIYLISAHFPSD